MQDSESTWLGVVLLATFFIAGILRGATNHPGRMMHSAHLLILLAWVTYIASVISTVAAEDVSLNLLVGLALFAFVTGFGWMITAGWRSSVTKEQDSAARNGWP